MEKNNKIVFGIIAMVFLLSLFLNGFEDTTGAGVHDVRLADLKVASTTITSTTIGVTVENAGLEDAKGFVIGFYEKTAGIDEEPADIGSIYIDEVRAGKQINIEHEWNQKYGGDREIQIILDREGKIREKDEGNNLYKEIVTSKPSTPDIFVSNIAVGLDTITIKIENSGADTTQDFLVWVYKIDSTSTIIHKETLHGILYGTENAKTVAFDYNLPDDETYTIRVVADKGTNIPELNEGNNIKDKIIN